MVICFKNISVGPIPHTHKKNYQQTAEQTCHHFLANSFCIHIQISFPEDTPHSTSSCALHVFAVIMWKSNMHPVSYSCFLPTAIPASLSCRMHPLSTHSQNHLSPQTHYVSVDVRCVHIKSTATTEGKDQWEVKRYKESTC